MWTQALLSIAAVSLVSLIGGITFILRARFDLMVTALTAFAAGGLLGNSFLHMLPSSIEIAGFDRRVSFAVLAGLLVFFLFEKLWLWRHEHGDGSHAEHAMKPYAFMTLFGDGLHNFIDGVVIATAFAGAGTKVGISTTLAVILHEVPQELGDFGILVKGGIKPSRALLLNFLSSLVAFAGGAVAILIGERHREMFPYVLPFSAGGFIYIAAADLIPEMHREMSRSRSVLQVVLLIAGMAFMALLLGSHG
ncbi:MAG: ZIP family metal transporter [Planctomycetota bacterium]